MNKKIYVAWFVHEDLDNGGLDSDTINSMAFTDKSSMEKWIEEKTDLAIKDCGVSREDYENDECNVSIYWDYKVQTLNF